MTEAVIDEADTLAQDIWIEHILDLNSVTVLTKWDYQILPVGLDIEMFGHVIAGLIAVDDRLCQEEPWELRGKASQ